MSQIARANNRQLLKEKYGTLLRNTYIVYDGPSMLTGEEVVVLASGFVRDSDNGKTGPILQVSVLVKGMHPQDAIDTGMDCSICGNCPFRKASNNGRRLCYVTMKPFFGMYRALLRGSYTTLPDFDLFKGWEVRLGAYGDPAAVPEYVLRHIVYHAEMATGYTHSWKHFPYLNDLCMASVVSDREYRQAKRMGFQTFRVRRSGDGSLYPHETCCPAKTRGLTCQECRLCSVVGVDVANDVHGMAAIIKAFNERYPSVRA